MGAESNGKLPHLFIRRKTAALDPELAMEDLPLDRTVTLVSEFVVEDLPLDSTVTLVLAFALGITLMMI